MPNEPDWTSAIRDAERWLTATGGHGPASVNLARCIIAAHEERERLRDGADETEPPPGWRHYPSLPMADTGDYTDEFWSMAEHFDAASIEEAWVIHRRMLAPFVAAATRELRAERDRLAEERDAARRGWAHAKAILTADRRLLTESQWTALERDCLRAMFGVDEARRLFPAPTPDTSGPQEPTE